MLAVGWSLRAIQLVEDFPAMSADKLEHGGISRPICNRNLLPRLLRCLDCFTEKFGHCRPIGLPRLFAAQIAVKHAGIPTMANPLGLLPRCKCRCFTGQFRDNFGGQFLAVQRTPSYEFHFKSPSCRSIGDAATNSAGNCTVLVPFRFLPTRGTHATMPWPQRE